MLYVEVRKDKIKLWLNDLAVFYWVLLLIGIIYIYIDIYQIILGFSTH